jgi:hypothetical protein
MLVVQLVLKLALPLRLLLLPLLAAFSTSTAAAAPTNLVGEVPARHIRLSVLQGTTNAKLPTGCSFIDVEVGQCRWAGQERS